MLDHGSKCSSWSNLAPYPARRQRQSWGHNPRRGTTTLCNYSHKGGPRGVVSDFKKGAGPPSVRIWFIIVLLACDLAIWRSVSLPVMSAALKSTSRFIILSMITVICIPLLGSQLLVQPTTGLKRAASAVANALTSCRAVSFCGLLCEGEQT